MIKIPDTAYTILNALESNGYEAYVVGGCVRDSLLGLTPRDWDICTNALPQDTIRCLPGYRIIQTGIRHGTVTVLSGKSSFEVTTFRLDGTYSDHRRPDRVEFVRSLKEDLKRRDFTVNAMAYHAKKGLIDYFNGQDDLRQKIIRCVGDPNRRFEEDALRILRALRFASVYGFRLESATAQAAVRCRSLLDLIAGERVREELCKLLCGEFADVMLFSFTSIFAVVLPEILDFVSFSKNNPNQSNLWEATVKSLKNVPAERILRLTMLLHDLGKPSCFTVDMQGNGHYYRHAEKSAAMAKHILHRLKFDTASISCITQLICMHEIKILPTEIGVRRLLNRLGSEQFLRLLEVKKADILSQASDKQTDKLQELKKAKTIQEKVLNESQCFQLKSLAVNGSDLLDAGIPQGIHLGQTLHSLLRMVIDGKLENRKDCLIAHCIKEGWVAHEHFQTKCNADRNRHQ